MPLIPRLLKNAFYEAYFSNCMSYADMFVLDLGFVFQGYLVANFVVEIAPIQIAPTLMSNVVIKLLTILLIKF